VIRWIKTCIWILLSAPLSWNLFLGFDGRLGPDPGKALVDSFGLWALRILLLTLVLRPLREITGRVEFIQVRRLVGLFALFYASLHFAAAIFYVVGWSLPDLAQALTERTYIILGLAAWLILFPLGLTSNRWSQRRMGRRWRTLHKAIYPAAIFVCLHFIWLVRSDYWQPAFYTFVLMVLLAWRLPIINRAAIDRSRRFLSDK
jgi:sulfoxide reductase heme-binding subunit YedZ